MHTTTHPDFNEKIEAMANEWLEHMGDDIDVISWDWQSHCNGAWFTLVLYYAPVQKPAETGFKIPEWLDG